MDCSKCSKELLYEPYYCISCEQPTCLFCLQTGEDMIICTCCYKEQNNIPDLEKGKCEHPDHQIPGDKTEKLFDIYKCECGQKMDMCEDHSKKCKHCRVRICSNCKDYCIKDGGTCGKCNKRVSKYTTSTCVICNTLKCNYCFMGVKIFGLVICRDHLVSCNERVHSKVPNIYQIKSFMCEFEGCKGMMSCSDLWFRKRKTVKKLEDVIKMCHKHVDVCKGCNKNYPLTKTWSIKYKNSGETIKSCFNCFRGIKTFVDIFLIKYKNRGIKEIIDVIVKNVFCSI